MRDTETGAVHQQRSAETAKCKDAKMSVWGFTGGGTVLGATIQLAP